MSDRWRVEHYGPFRLGDTWWAALDPRGTHSTVWRDFESAINYANRMASR